MNKNTRKIVDGRLVSQMEIPNYLPINRELTESEKTRKKISRNAPCTCGSGKKLKRCCIEKYNNQ